MHELISIAHSIEALFLRVFLLWVFLGAVGSYLLWPLYVAVMGWEKARLDKKFGLGQIILASPWFALAVTLDWLLNVFFYSVVFLDFTHWKSLSARLADYNSTSDPATLKGRYRLYVCNFFEPMLNPYDPAGTHIGTGPL